jgi:hypothetical protein
MNLTPFSEAANWLYPDWEDYHYPFKRFKEDALYRLGIGLLYGCYSKAARPYFSPNAAFVGKAGVTFPKPRILDFGDDAMNQLSKLQ